MAAHMWGMTRAMLKPVVRTMCRNVGSKETSSFSRKHTVTNVFIQRFRFCSNSTETANPTTVSDEAEVKVKEDQLNKWFSAHVKVPQDIAGLMIGHGGRNLRVLESLTCCKLHVDKDEMDHSSRVFQLRSQLEQNLKNSEQLFKEMLQFTLDTKNTIPEDWVSKSVENPIPSLNRKFVGRCLGFNGMNMKRLQLLTLCKIQVEDSAIIVSGKSLEQVNVCLRLINEMLKKVIDEHLKSIERKEEDTVTIRSNLSEEQ